jgi:hypothetical protein
VDHDIRGRAAVAVRSFARIAGFGLVLLLIAEVQQCSETTRGDHDDVPAVPAVPAVRSSPRDILFPSEAADPAAAVPGFHENADFIDEHKTPQSLHAH